VRATAQQASPWRDRSRLHAAMDQLKRFHGKNALYFASAHDALDQAPMRIAFNRIRTSRPNADLPAAGAKP
jgi:hypothetical protein